MSDNLPKLIPATEGQVQLAQHARRQWAHVAREGVQRQQLLDPAYWVHVNRTMRHADHIEVWAWDRSWWVELLVVDHSPVLRVECINDREFSAGERMRDDDYEVRYLNMEAKNAVIDRATGDIISQGHDTPDAANLWLSEHRKTMSRSKGRAKGKAA